MSAVKFLVAFLSFARVVAETGGEIRPLIIGGERVNNSEKHPYAARMSFDGAAFCGATIYAPDKLLTAAHCFFDDEGNRRDEEGLSVVAGCIEPITSGDRKCQEIDVLRVVVHQDFSMKDKNRSDIAIVFLSSELKFDGSVDQIGILDSRDSTQPETGTVVGWGCTEEPDIETGCDNKNLYEAEVPIFSSEQCHQRHSNITDVQRCAGGNRRGTCRGDSGGPLLCRRREVLYLCGILSYGHSSCNATIPDVYTNPAAYSDWIRQDRKIVPILQNKNYTRTVVIAWSSGLAMGILVVLTIWKLYPIVVRKYAVKQGPQTGSLQL